MPFLHIPYSGNQNNSVHGNICSVAMVLKFLGPDRTYGCPVDASLENQMQKICENRKWSIQDPFDLQSLIRFFGISCFFLTNSKWRSVEEHLQDGKPAIIHGYFVNSGGTVVVCGYSEDSWICNDPRGRWDSGGYDRASGEAAHYSRETMRQLCGRDGDLWVHFVG
jgi:Peptidase_C39 like family